jgi:hypothetical protein
VIVHGKVTSVDETIVDLRGVRTPYRITHIEPFEVLKGIPNTASGKIEVWDLGGHDDRGYLMVVEGEVVFSEGEEVVVFLSWLGPEEKRYLSPNGWRRGTFVVDPGPDRTLRISEVAAREFRGDRRPSEHDDEVLVLLDDFLENIRRLVE